MAKNALTIFDQPQVMIPDYLRDTIGDEKNIVDRVTVPSLAYSGKVWAIHKDGEKTKITKKDDDGDEISVPLIRVAVLAYAAKRGRTYYEGNYDPDKPGAPICWSEDGVKPHTAVAEPQSPTCDSCPLAVKGSKMTENGRSVAACSQHRMLVVAPLAKLDMPLRMKIAITSDWDKQNDKAMKENWFAFSNYTDFLRTRNVAHTAMVVTKMKFDNNVDYPKVMFSADRLLNEDEAGIVKPLIRSEEVKNLLSGTYTPAGVDGKKIAGPVDEEEDDAPPPPKKAAPAKAAPKKAVEDDEEEEDDEAPPPPKKAAPTKAAPKKAAAVEDDEEEDDAPPPPKKAAPAKAAPKKAAAVEEVDEEEEAPKPKKGKANPDVASGGDPLAGILEDWGDD